MARINFRYRIILVLSLAHVLMLLLLIGVGHNYVHELMESEFEKRIHLLEAMLISASKEAFIASDPASLNELAVEALAQHKLVYLKFVSASDKELAAVGMLPDKSATIRYDHDFDEAYDGIFDFFLQVEEAGEIFGYIEGGVNTTVSIAVLNEISQSALLGVFISFLLYALLVYFVARYVNSRMQPLVKGLTAIENGKLDFRIDEKGDDEISRSAMAFNRMSARLSDLYLELSESLSLNRQQRELAQESEKRLRAVMDHAMEGIIVATEDGQIIEFNKAAQKLFGYKEEELLGKKVNRLMPTGMSKVHDAYMESYRERGFTNLTQDYREVQGVHKNGKTLMLQVSLNALSKKGNKLLLAFIRDVSAVREMEKASRLALEQQRIAEESSRAKSSFLANMSHEIRSPLTAIIGYSEQLLEMDVAADEREQKLTVIQRNGKHLLGIINNILDLSKIEADKLEIESLPFELESFLREMDSLVAGRVRDKGLEFTWRLSYPLPDVIKTDALRLRQVLINLCSNAIKFTREGSVSIELECNWEQEQLQFRVIDTGLGMNSEQQRRVFEAFSQADESTSRQYGGTGLGLTISNYLVKHMGGQLTVESEPGKGSCFSFRVNTGKLEKRQPIEHIEFKQDAETRWQLDIPTLSGKVLIADDNTDNQALISHMVERTGATTMLASNGEEAVTAALANSFDLILMDMQMPVMDGMEATRLLRQASYSGDICALTASTLQTEVQAFLQAGCNHYLSKPLERGKFYYLLAQCLPAESEADSSVDDEKFMIIRKRFLTGFPVRLKKLNNALSENDHEELARQLHDIKGSAGLFRFQAISEQAGELMHNIDQADSLWAQGMEKLIAMMQTEADNIENEPGLDDG